MLKNLLHLYNDGHNPFPNMGKGGLGYHLPQYRKMVHGDGFNLDTLQFDPEEEEQPDPKDPNKPLVRDKLRREALEQYHEMFPPQEEEPMTENERLFHEWEQQHPEPTEEEYEQMNWRPLEELEEIGRNTEQREKDLSKINERITTTKGMLDNVEELEKDITTIDKDIKAEKKKIVINNLEKSKAVATMISNVHKDNDTFLESVARGKVKKCNVQQVRDAVDTFIDAVNQEDFKDLNTETVMDILNGVIKNNMNVDKKHFDDLRIVAAKISYMYAKLYDEKGDNEQHKFFAMVSDILFRAVQPKLRNEIEIIDRKNVEIEKQIQQLQMKKLGIKHKIDSNKALKEIIKEEQQEYNDRVQHYKARERDIRLKYEPKKHIETSYEGAVEEPKKTSKPTKVKAVKKSEEEKESELIHADAVTRLDYIDKKISSNGKDLETYLSNKGQTILQAITGDRSQVYDNELNKEIPNINVMLSNGETGSLRKAVTLDLYNNDNVFEIKNYKEYSIDDKVIPLQVTKLEGTGYFKPLYLQNGNLYNIELNYIDPKTGVKTSKLIMPENPDGRELVLIYRLKDGLYQFKPLESNHVKLKKIGHLQTKDGKPLYDFMGSSFSSCSDHYGNPSFNIQPYLRKIKI